MNSVAVRPSVINWMVWMLLWAVAAFGLYMVKYQVQAKKIEVARTEHQLAMEEKNLHVLEAEWAYLTRPERLAQLTTQYTDEAPVSVKQVTNFAGLPYSPASMQAQNNSTLPASGSSVALNSGALRAR